MTKNLRKRSTTFMATVVAIIISLVVFLPMIAACGKSEVTITGLNKTTATVQVGKEVALTATYSRELDEGETVEVIWTSDKTDVATVDANGKVKGVKAGEAKITATLGESTASCTVTVKDSFAVTLDKTSAKLDLDSVAADKTVTLTATATKNGAAEENAAIEWKSSDSAVATVANGVVTAVSVGSATITATYEGASASCDVQVISFNAPYTVTAGNSNANIAKDPGVWYYFLKTSDGVAGYEGEELNRTVEGGKEKIEAKFDKIEILEGKEYDKLQFYLRYMPTYEIGQVYTVSFKFVSNTAGRVEIGDKVKTSFEANQEVFVITTQTVTENMPLNIKLFVVGENVQFTVSEITFEEGDHVPDQPAEPMEPTEPTEPTEPVVETYDLTATTSAYQNLEEGKWYYISSSGTVTEAKYENGVVTATIQGATNKEENQNNSNQRFVFIPKGGMANGDYKVSFTVEVSAKAEIGYGNSGGSKDGYFSVKVQNPAVEANTPTTYTDKDYTHGSPTKTDLKPFMIQVRKLESAGDITIKISNVVITPVTAA